MRPAAFDIDGKTIGFIAREVPRTVEVEEQCKGCLFEGKSFRVCNAAGDHAAEAGQPDCEDAAPGKGSYIYVEADPRQLVLEASA